MIDQNEVNLILKQFLEAHDVDVTSENDWFIPNGSLPAIRCIWHEAPEKQSGRLDVHVLIDQNIMIEESFAGIGEGISGLKDGFQNFAVNSLHVLLAAFWEVDDPEQVLTEDWKFGSKEYKVFIGNFGTRATDGVHPGVPEDTFSFIENALKKMELSEDVHWVRTFFCNIGKDRIYESLLDNENWKAGEKALKKVNWPESEGYYSVRNFIVLRKNS